MQWRNPTRNAAGTIDVEINHPRYGWIPFTADAADTGAGFDVAALVAEIEAGAVPDAPPPPPLQTTQITFARLIGGLVTERWISKPEGQAWLRGTPPAPVTDLIAQLPEAEQIFAEGRAIRPSIVLRSDPLVIALGTMQGKTPAQLDAFFNTYGAA